MPHRTLHRRRVPRTRAVLGALTAGLLAAAGLVAAGQTSRAATARQAEALDRGVVSVHTDSGNLVSWRWLGTDPDNVAFNVYRAGTKVNATPVTGSTNYFHNGAPSHADYTVRAVVGGTEQSDSVHAIETGTRITTLLQDTMYRTALAWQNTAYSQPPHPSFAIGSEMAAAPRPVITTP